MKCESAHDGLPPPSPPSYVSLAKKNHRNGIKKPKSYRYPSMKGVSSRAHHESC